MKYKTRYFWVFLALTASWLLSACSPTAAQPVTASPAPSDTEPSSTPTASTPASTGQPAAPTLPTSPTPSMASEFPPQFLAAQAEIARTYGYTTQEVGLISHESVDWPDSCLGIYQEGMACLDVITPGYRAIFSTPQGEVEVHTNADGSSYRIAVENTGIDGLALLVNACPGPVHLETPCPERPYQGVLIVLDTSEETIAEVQTSADGRFRVNLPPGSYTVTVPPGKPLPALPPQEVLVRADQYTLVELRLESGMR